MAAERTPPVLRLQAAGDLERVGAGAGAGGGHCGQSSATLPPRLRDREGPIHAPTPIDPDLEAAEVAAYLDVWSAAPAGLASAHGISAAEIACGVCLAVASAPESRILNHAIGLGAGGPVPDEDLDAVERFYADAGADHFVAARGELAERLRLRGYRDDMPPAFAGWMNAIPGRPGWTWLVAWSGDDAAGVGALFAHGEVGWLGFGATRPASPRARRPGRHPRRPHRAGRGLGLRRLVRRRRSPGGRPRALVPQRLRASFREIRSSAAAPAASPR